MEPPARPRVPEALASEIDPDIDPDFPDVVDVRLSDCELSFPDARTLTVIGSLLERCRVAGDTTAAIDAADTRFVDVDLTGRVVESLTRVELSGCRMGGVDLGGARLRDVRFDGCILDVASMRGARLERVVVDGGRVDGLDLSGAHVSDARFADVPLDTVSLDGVRLQRVDLTAADLAAVTDVSTIRGATISEVQAMELAGRLARAAGLDVAQGP